MELEKIGENAGKIWHVLNEGRELTIPELSRRIDQSHEDTTIAIGWLARENKIYIQRKNGQIYVSNGVLQGLYFGINRISGKLNTTFRSFFIQPMLK